MDRDCNSLSVATAPTVHAKMSGYLIRISNLAYAVAANSA